MTSLRRIGLTLIAGMGLPFCSFAQESLPKIGAGAKVSTLGIGVEGATALTDKSNLRFGFNIFDYDRDLEKRGIEYVGSLNLRSIHVTYDQYLAGGFHISPGLLLYNGNRVNANASVPPGDSFTLGGVSYYSNPANPITGTAEVDLRRIAPMILAGVGNVLPRNDRRLGVNFDAGVVFQGSPRTNLVLTGTACTAGPASGCLNAGTDPTVQSNVRAEQEKLNDDLKPFKYFPVISIGVNWKF